MVGTSGAATIRPRAIRVAVIGAGMAGILASIRLRQQGIDHVVFEKADRVGGTWRENTYPGLSCDVPAHSYTYTFARNPTGAGGTRQAARSSATSSASPTSTA